jgi:membrane-anchored glycerophosphoryl diester phosphodiesterase (GDPDase)
MLIGLLVVLILAGVALAMFPVDPTVRKMIIFALVVLFVLWLLAALGMIGDYGFARPTRL